MQDELNEAAPASSEQADAPKIAARLTRKRVADQLGVSIFKVRSMEGKELHPEIVGGVHYFDPDEVASLAWSRGPKRRGAHGEPSDGEIAALAFHAFDDGKDLFEIVTQLRIPPEKVRALYREWREPDLEQHEVARRKRERVQMERRREREEQYRHDREMDQLDQALKRLARPRL
jgi:hypothetical protein